MSLLRENREEIYRIVYKVVCDRHVVAFGVTNGKENMELNYKKTMLMVKRKQISGYRVDREDNIVSGKNKLSELRVVKRDKHNRPIENRCEEVPNINLWHGTWEDNMKNIIKVGYIRNKGVGTSEGTVDIGKVLPGRSGCIYLSAESESEDAFDYAFKINTSRLDKNLLHVADNRIADAVYEELMGEGDKERLKRLAEEYKRSFMKYSEYMKVRQEYDKRHFAEFLYYGSIKVNKKDLD